ncbi:MAG: XrtA system polysaccharide deacetylase [Bacillota bacterium]
MRRCLLSFDVEDWFQVENLRGAIPRESWDDCELRVIQNTARILDLLDCFGRKATFFVLGWVAHKVPGLVKEIAKRGHEVASHGYSHELVYRQSEEAFREDVRRAKWLLEDLIGDSVVGYRAPSFSLTDRGLRILWEEGYRYDSSVFPSSLHDRYFRPREVESALHSGVGRTHDGLVEILVPTLDVGPLRIPWGGGGYFRAVPYGVYRWGVNRILGQRGVFLFYLHPWEIDAEQPRVRGLSWSLRQRHYLGLANTYGKVARLIADYPWEPVSAVVSAPGA